MSYGILSIQPKFADGTPIENIEDAIITSNGKEIKAWAAIATYLESLEDTNGDGIADVPEYYASSLNRKVVEDSTAISDLLKKPNKYAVIIIIVGLIIIALVILLVMAIVKLIRKIVHRISSKNRIEETNAKN